MGFCEHKSHSGGRRFDPGLLHQKERVNSIGLTLFYSNAPKFAKPVSKSSGFLGRALVCYFTFLHSLLRGKIMNDFSSLHREDHREKGHGLL